MSPFGGIAEAECCPDGCPYIRFTDAAGQRAIGHLGSLAPAVRVDHCIGCMRWLHEPFADEIGFDEWRYRREGVVPVDEES